jgi:glycerol uptake facilitator protein
MAWWRAFVLKKSKAENAGWMVITTGWALAVMAGVFVAMACGGEGHLNPAVTVGVAVGFGGFQQGRVVRRGADGGSVPGSVPGMAALSATLARDARCRRQARLLLHGAGHPQSAGQPDERDSVGTFVLVLVADAIFSKTVAATGPAAGLGPYLVGSLVWGIGLSLGGTTGYAINPARDLGPRIAHAILPIPEKGGSDWGYAAVPVVGPLLGGIAGRPAGSRHPLLTIRPRQLCGAGNPARSRLSTGRTCARLRTPKWDRRFRLSTQLAMRAWRYEPRP